MDKLIILAMIGALIGWMTNVVAIKLMFRPINPIRLLKGRIIIQGVIPKRKLEISKSIGDTVEEELLSIEEIVDKIISDMDKNEMIEMIQKKVTTLVNSKMPTMLPSMFKSMILQNIDQVIEENGDQIIVELGETLTHKAVKSIDISKMVEDRINSYDFEKIEYMVLKIAQKELKHIELLGGVIGFVIGLIQGILILFLI